MTSAAPALLAAQVLLREGTGRLPVDIVGIFRQMDGVKLVTFHQLRMLMPEQADELIGRNPSVGAFLCQPLQGAGKLVCYDSSAMPGRVRFSLAHELGHILLGHEQANERTEREANLFASALLMPRCVVLVLWRDRRMQADEIARFLGVSKTAASLALRDCGGRTELDDRLLGLFGPALEQR